MFFLTIIVLGIIAFFNLSVELSPHVEFPKLMVYASWHGVSPEVMEAYVTSPIESELSTIKGLKNIKSRSSIGFTSITLEFYPKTNINFTRVEINEKLAALREELPFGVSPPVVSQYIPQDLRQLQGFITYSISGNESASKIRKYVTEKMRYPLMSINGVSNVTVKGGTHRQITIVIDYNKAKSFNIGNDEITKAIGDIENILSAGALKINGSQYLIKIENKINNIDVIRNQPVKLNADGSLIRLKDIARVYDDYAKPTSYYRINGKETVSLIISKEEGANTLKTAEKIYTKMKTLKAALPKGYRVIKEIDRSQSIRNELRQLTKSGLFSFAIIIAVLFLIYKRIKYALIITTSIVFSLLFSFLLFYIFKIPLNILTIAAFILGFGFMVDNSIVVIDYIDSHYDGRGIKYLTVHLKNIFMPVFASTLTTVAVFLPLLFLTGEMRLYFTQFALGIVFTLSASLIVSFSIIPLMFKRYVKRRVIPSVEKKSFLFDIYSFIMKKLLKWKKLSFTVLILMIGLPVWLLPDHINTPVLSNIYNPIFESYSWSEIKPYFNYILGGSLNLFFNHIERGEVWNFGQETYLYISLDLPNGNKIDRINRLTKNFEKQILRYRKNIKNLIVNVYDEESASIRIEFTKKQSETAFPYILKNYLTSYATRLGGLNVGVSGFGPGFYNGGGASFGNSVVVKGFNFLSVKKLAGEFRNIIVRNPRIANVDIDKSMVWGTKDTYEIVANVNRNKLAEYDIPIEELFANIAKNTEGNLTYNRFKIKGEEVQYNVKFSNYRNLQLNKLENIIIHTNNGEALKIKDLMNFKKEKILPAINRENQQYVRYITFDFRGPYKYGIEFTKASLKKMIIPEGYSMKINRFNFLFGQKEEIEVWKILLMSMILIFMITASLFESLKKPSLIFIAIPFAIVGTLFLFYFGDYNLDRGAYAGILLLIGLSVNNSIILIDYLSKSNHLSFNKIIEKSFTRLRPIFSTTFTTIAALIPLLISSETSFWKSLSLSVTGGIFLSAVIVILYLPIIYYLIEKRESAKAGF